MKKLLLLLSLVLYVGQINAQLCFSPASGSPFLVGTHLEQVISADFNGDGFKDIATANWGSNNISVLLGDGAGNFGVATNFAAGTSPNSVCSADFNGDGKADLAVADYGTSSSIGAVAILLGTGTGSFGAVSYVYYSCSGFGTNPTYVISADFNGDGKADLATLNQASNNQLAIFLGTGTGSFGAATFYGVGGSAVVSEDFNGDTKLDLAAASGGDILILLGTGTGSFVVDTFYTVGSNLNSLCSGDFNGDTKLDLATAGNADTLSVLLGTGIGSFGIAQSYTVEAGTNANSVISTDFNRDGKLDLATSNYGSSNLSVLLGTGTGSFGSATNFAVGSNPFKIVSADFNGDTMPDIAGAFYVSNNVFVLISCTATGITNFNNEKIIYVYPNPTSDQFYIEANTTDKLNVDLYDVNGRHVFNTTVIDKSNINVSNLNEGVYTMTIKSVDRVTNKKLVIVR